MPPRATFIRCEAPNRRIRSYPKTSSSRTNLTFTNNVSMCGGPVNQAPVKKRKERQSPLREVDWEDFRDHLTTADQQGNRRWLYPKQVEGQFYRLRTYVSWLLLTIMFAGPFIRIH